MGITALLFVGGPADLPADFLGYREQADIVICVDSGAVSAASLSLIPDHLIGDLDSVPVDLLAKYQDCGVDIHRYPARKNETDLELAMNLALAKEAGTMYLINSLGGRWDMSLANILLTAQKKYAAIAVFHVGATCVMRILHPGRHEICNRSGQLISLLPLEGEVTGINLSGFEYPLANETLPFGSTRGVSNRIINTLAAIELQTGILLCIEQGEENPT
ncbi:thiamine diphosphokinase [Desulfopila sp. IMCC35008]|uniref:thiamine diphosphokinase n=1 Tax=Desulfopila sp. IMCC35008 TaxID=2653858 RepID=UPI0013D1D6FB|nr:thiamine diphosphokinase [Desulfopila sp. IMCC35008]